MAPSVPSDTPAELDTGIHAYRDHNQFCRFENIIYRFPFEDKSIPAFEFFDSNTSVNDALAKTKLLVLLGAADSPELARCMDDPDTIIMIFEPDERALEHFVEQVPLERLSRPGLIIFSGDLISFFPALQDFLPGTVFEKGTPAIFQTKRIQRDFEEWAYTVVEYIEILHYRHHIYPLTGQFLARSRPLRKIKRGPIYDQQLHAYENIPAFLTTPDISHIRGHFRGHSAIVVAAGPDLANKIDYIKRNRSRAVVICVNNALKPLVEAGVKPHFTIINDISIASGQVFKHIPKQPGTILVAQCLSDLGGDTFQQRYLFGNFLTDVFGVRQDLRLHGSVISAAFFLSLHLGCERCVFVGGQLASDNPWGLGYAKGTVKDELSCDFKPLINKHPQLYPVESPYGDTLFTTPNFRDAALWLCEMIRQLGAECYNTSKASILYGPGITYDPEPELPEMSVNRLMADLYKPVRLNPDIGLITKYVQHELTKWTSVRNVARSIMNEDDPNLLDRCKAILDELDKSNVTNLLERYEDFNNFTFSKLAFSENNAEQVKGFHYYFNYLEQMCNELLRHLVQAKESCRRIAHDLSRQG